MATPAPGTLPALAIRSVEESEPAREAKRELNCTNLSDGLRRQASILWRVWNLPAWVKPSHEQMRVQPIKSKVRTPDQEDGEQPNAPLISRLWERHKYLLSWFARLQKNRDWQVFHRTYSQERACDRRYAMSRAMESALNRRQG